MRERLIANIPDGGFEYVRQNDGVVPPGEAWLCEWDGDEHNGMELHQATVRCPCGKPGDRVVVEVTDVRLQQSEPVGVEPAWVWVIGFKMIEET